MRKEMPKTQTFEEYFKNWKKKQPMKFTADGIPIADLGETSGEVSISAPDPLKRKGKKKGRVRTRIKLVKPLEKSTPKKTYVGIKSAGRRRKGATAEI